LVTKIAEGGSASNVTAGVEKIDVALKSVEPKRCLRRNIEKYCTSPMGKQCYGINSAFWANYSILKTGIHY
jgi:hypothetical protein